MESVHQHFDKKFEGCPPGSATWFGRRNQSGEGGMEHYIYLATSPSHFIGFSDLPTSLTMQLRNCNQDDV